MIRLVRLASAALLANAALLAAPASAEAPFSLLTTPGRLPKNVIPLAYTLALTPDVNGKSIRGVELVQLDITAPTATISFNTLHETLADVRFDGAPVNAVESSDDRQITTLTLAAPAGIGRHTLSFTYLGRIETLPQGLFVQPFAKPGGGGDGVLLSTLFEATDARRMFPCWDEPAFRATFELSVTLPSEWTAISNMPIAGREQHGATATVQFLRTPRMPSYLVHLSAGDFAAIYGRSGATRLGVWAVRGQEQYGAEALANAQQILADYNDYFGLPFPLPKLDSIAVPGGFQGAMEDWGSISYNDQALLITPSSTLGNRQEVFSIQAHEMAHQWHGDLVTMGWWDDLWLNESFASWRAAQETDLRHPDWHWWEREDASKENAMAADARVAAPAIEQHITDELQANNAFDSEITYDKGQAVLRMLEAHLGPDTFRAGIRRLLKARAYSNASTADLWNALSAAAGHDVGTVARSWTQQPGFPLVSVAADCAADGSRLLHLSQQRFLLQAKDPAGGSQWRVPLLVRSGVDAIARPVLLTSTQQTVAAGRCGEALSLNAGAVGYFRVAYDDASLRANVANFARLPSGDRIALLDDQWALAETGTQPLAHYLELAEAMGDSQNERAWSQIAAALDVIEFDLRGTPDHDALASYALALVKPLADRLGWDARAGESPGLQRLRRTLLAELGEWGDAATISEARRRFDGMRANRAAIRADDQQLILTIVARFADAATFEQLHTFARSASNETELRRYYPALMNVRDAQLATVAAGIALSSEIPPQADSLRSELVFTLQKEHPLLAWETYTAHAEALLAPFQPSGPLYEAQYFPDVFWNSVPLEQIEAWVRARVPAEMSAELARGLESARFQLELRSRLQASAHAFLSSRH